MTDEVYAKAVELKKKISLLESITSNIDSLPIIVNIGSDVLRLDNASTDEVEANVYQSIVTLIESYKSSVNQQYENL